MIVFENPGLIDTLAISTFGINAKVADNPIGFFGTGLKYAIAVLLRTGHTITIYRGTDRIDFDVRKHETRGKTFELVTMKNEPMGFTTELGKQWELWQAFRELWCNCVDEGGKAFTANFYEPQPDKTAVTVNGAEFGQIYARRSDFILTTEPLYRLNGVDVHRGARRTIFYRGIAVGMMPENQQPLYTYNIIDPLTLTEDRTVKYSWQPAERVAHAIQTTDNREFIEEAVRAKKGTFERSIDYIFHATEPSLHFVEVVERVRQTHSHDMNNSAKRQAEAHRPLPPIKEFEPNDLERGQYDDARLFLSGLGYEIAEYPITFVEKLGNNILGLAEDGGITISRDAFIAGTKQLAITLLEEFLHLKHNVEDETRAMQERLLHELVTLGERYVLGRAL